MFAPDSLSWSSTHSACGGGAADARGPVRPAAGPESAPERSPGPWRWWQNSAPVVTTVPMTSASPQAATCVTAPGTNAFRMPPCGTIIRTPAASEIAPATAEPSMQQHRLEAGKGLRQPDVRRQPAGEVAGQKAGEDRAEEAGLDL